MRRIISVLAIMAIMAAMVAASAMPAFAASGDSSCKGVFFSEVLTPGQKGELISSVAKSQGGVGQELGEIRSCNPNASEQGGGR
jgi:hypothetical protein